MPGRINLSALKNSIERMQNRKNRKEAAMEAEKIKIQDEKDMLDVQGAKDGGRMGLKMGSKGCGKANKGRGRAYGNNS